LAAAAKQGEIVPDAPFLGLADLCTATCDVWPSPEVAFELSMIPTRLTPVDPARVAAYAEASALDLRYMLATGFGAYVGAPSAGRRREVAIALIDAGLGSGVRLASRALRHARAVRARTARSSIRARVHR
jgi:hypothetical protein